MLRGYLRLVVFALGLLVGVQGPAFVDQYAKRVSAHYLEVKRDFAGFQQAADQYFNGDVSALVAHHLQSPDVVFRGEAKTIGELFARIKSLAAEMDALNGSTLARLIHIIVNPNREILQETIAAYSYTVPLSPEAISYGVITGLILALAVELMLAGLAGVCWNQWQRMTRGRRHPPARLVRREPSIAAESERGRRQ
ncbi:MAG TPA: DUF2937 family protein [Steroidobacteraceae bacterium]|jgi:hypothetical protein|nr:DUF2937 family protein [Steroidobacteraceae bacterium]